MATVSNGPFTRRRLALAITKLENTVHNTLAPGQTFYVNAATTGASNSNAGTDPSVPLATIDAAVGKCSAARGDVIIVGPGHTESITSATSLVIDISGISIIGVGNGRLRPKLTFTTATAANIPISAANVRVKNLVFDLTGFDAVAAGITVSAADCTIEDCEFIIAGATNQAVLGILTTAAADRLTIQKNLFYGTTDAGCTSVISLVGGDQIRIVDNDFQVACGASAGAIAGATTDSTNLLIHNNRIQNKTASSTKAIVLTATSTGLITNNRVGILSSNAPFTAAGTQSIGNVYSATAGVTAGTASTF